MGNRQQKPQIKSANNITANAPRAHIFISISILFSQRQRETPPTFAQTLPMHKNAAFSLPVFTTVRIVKNRRQSPQIISPYPETPFPRTFFPEFLYYTYFLSILSPYHIYLVFTPPSLPCGNPHYFSYRNSFSRNLGIEQAKISLSLKAAFARYKRCARKREEEGKKMRRTLLPTECAVFARMYINKKSQTCVWLFCFVCPIY